MTASGFVQEQLVTFVHIPKTAGSTIKSIIKRQYKQSETAIIERQEIYKERIDEIEKQLKEGKSIRLILGHVGFGIHEFLSHPYTYITLLRHPIQRTISHYYYSQNKPEKAKRNNFSIEEFCQLLSSNIMVRYLSGVELQYQIALGSGKKLRQARQARQLDLVLDNQCSSEEMLELAKKNLREHCLIGVTERFDESLILFKKALGWKNICYTRQNIAKNKPPESKISSETLAFIEKHNELDLELYNYAKDLFEERISQYGYSWESDLKLFQFSNYIYEKFYLFPKHIYSWLNPGNNHDKE